MTVENTTEIDVIGVERDSGKVVLTIADHLDWEDEHEHLMTLQEKLNTYVRFIESGEIDETYPDAAGRSRVIDVITQHRPPDGAREFFRRAAAVLHEAGVELRFSMLPE